MYTQVFTYKKTATGFSKNPGCRILDIKTQLLYQI